MQNERKNLYFFIYLAFVASLVVWPNYAELKIASLPNLAPDRILRFLLFFGLLWKIIEHRCNLQLVQKRILANSYFFMAIILYVAIRLMSSILSVSPFEATYIFLKNELLISAPIILFTFLAVKNFSDFGKIFLVLIISGVVVGVLGLIEYRKEENIFSSFVSEDSDYVMGVFLDKTRDFSYRVQGTFDHPILLGQFFVVLIPLIWIKAKECKSFFALAFYGVSAVLAVVSIYTSGSRSSQGFFIFEIFAITSWVIYCRSRKTLNQAISNFLITLIPGLIFIFVIIAIIFGENIIGSTDETISSTNSRFEMLVGGVEKISDNLFFGHGLSEAISVFSLTGRAGLQTLDNFYILTGIESGVFAPIILFLLGARVLYLIYSRIKFTDTSYNRYLFSFSLIIIFYLVQMGLHALTQQMWIYYIFLAITLLIINKKDMVNVNNSVF